MSDSRGLRVTVGGDARLPLAGELPRLPAITPDCIACRSRVCSRGQPTPGNAAYGACKRGLVQLRASLAAEAREANKAAAAGGSGGQVSVHLCSPGMVATDLLLRYATNPRSGGWVGLLQGVNAQGQQILVGLWEGSRDCSGAKRVG